MLKGLSILKDKPDPVAKEDSEYPAWLWTLLDESSAKKAAGGGEAAAALASDKAAHTLGKDAQADAEYFAKEKKRLRAA